MPTNWPASGNAAGAITREAATQILQAQRRYRGRKIVITLRKAFGFDSSAMGMNPWERKLNEFQTL